MQDTDCIQIKVIKDISKLIELVQTGTKYLFRGEPSDFPNTKLLPGVYRRRNQLHIPKPEQEWGMLLDWHNKMRELGHNQHIQNHWEILFEAQHYGLKTRLLDWSENPYFALWIACGGYDRFLNIYFKPTSDGFIYYIKPPYLPLVIDSIGFNILVNNLRWEGGSNRAEYDNPIFKISHEAESTEHQEIDFEKPHDRYSFNSKCYGLDSDMRTREATESLVNAKDREYKILFIKPAARANKRIVSQSGLFSVHVDSGSMGKEYKDEHKLNTIKISCDLKIKILEYLDTLNLNETTFGFTNAESYARKLNYELEK